MEVAVENDRAAGERSSKGAGEATQKHILACETKDTVWDKRRGVTLPTLIHLLRIAWHGRTCQVEVLQRSLRSYRKAELRAEAGDAMIHPIDLTFGGSDIVSVSDGGSSVDVFDLHKQKKQELWIFLYDSYDGFVFKFRK